MPPVASSARRVRWPARPVRTVAVGVIAVVVLAGCSGDQTPQVRTATVTRATVTEVVDAPGTVTPRAQATLTAPAPGTVTALLADEGTQVRAGQVIMRLRSRQAQQALTQARQALAQLQTSSPPSTPGPVSVAADPTPPSLPTDPTEAAQAASQAAAAAFAAARVAASQISDPQARAAALAAVATAQQQAQAAATSAATQTAATLDALTRQLAALQRQTQTVLEELTAAAQTATAGVAGTLSALSASQQAQAQAAVATAQATVDALTVRSPIDGLVSFDSSGAATSALDSAAGLAAGGAIAGGSGGLGGLGGPGGSLPGGSLTGAGKVTGPLSVGSPVAAGQVLATVTDTSQVTVTVDIDETDVLAVHPGVPATVLVDAVPDVRYTARVVTVAPAPRAGAGGSVVYPARLALQGGTAPGGGRPPDPRPGMSAVVDLVVRRVPDALSVPVASVFRSGQQDWVWLVRDGQVHRQQVRLGAEGSNRVQIVSGLSAGDVVVAGQSGQLREGQRVE